MTEADLIIDGLGGTSAVARLISAPISTVHSWRRIGIPTSRLAHMKLAAKTEGVDWPEVDESAHTEGDTAEPAAPSPGNPASDSPCAKAGQEAAA